MPAGSVTDVINAANNGATLLGHCSRSSSVAQSRWQKATMTSGQQAAQPALPHGGTESCHVPRAASRAPRPRPGPPNIM